MAKPKLEPFLWILTHYFFLVNLAWPTPSVDFLLSPHRGKHLWESLLALGEPTCPHNLSSHLFSSFIHPFSRLDISLEVKAFRLVLSRHLHLLSPGTKPVSDWAHHPMSLLVLAICPSARSKYFLRAFLCYSSNPSSLSALPICCPKHNKNPLFLPHRHCRFCGQLRPRDSHLLTSPSASAFSLLIQSAPCTTASYWKPKSDRVLSLQKSPLVLTVTFKILCGLAPASHTSHKGLPHSVLLWIHTLVLISIYVALHMSGSFRSSQRPLSWYPKWVDRFLYWVPITLSFPSDSTGLILLSPFCYTWDSSLFIIIPELTTLMALETQGVLVQWANKWQPPMCEWCCLRLLYFITFNWIKPSLLAIHN